MLPTIRPRFGFMLVVPLRNPFGYTTAQGVALDPAIDGAPSQWYEVVKLGERPEGMPDGPKLPYSEGDAVLLNPQQVEPIVMCEKVVGLTHEANVKASILHGGYSPEYQRHDTLAIMDQLREAAREKSTPKPRIALG